MDNQFFNINFNTVLNIALLIGMGITAYRVIRSPQEKSMVADASFGVRLNELQKRLDEEKTLRENHIHTLEVKLDLANDNIQKLALQLVELKTIISERLPRA